MIIPISDSSEHIILNLIIFPSVLDSISQSIPISSIICFKKFLLVMKSSSFLSIVTSCSVSCFSSISSDFTDSSASTISSDFVTSSDSTGFDVSTDFSTISSLSSSVDLVSSTSSTIFLSSITLVSSFCSVSTELESEFRIFFTKSSVPFSLTSSFSDTLTTASFAPNKPKKPCLASFITSMLTSFRLA